MSVYRSTMHLIYLPANQAWSFQFGTKLTSMDGQLLFPSRHDAVQAARRCKLDVDANGWVLNPHCDADGIGKWNLTSEAK